MRFDRKDFAEKLVGMNAKTAKVIGKYAILKGISEKQLKREWMTLSHTDKDKKRQEFLKEIVKK